MFPVNVSTTLVQVTRGLHNKVMPRSRVQRTEKVLDIPHGTENAPCVPDGPRPFRRGRRVRKGPWCSPQRMRQPRRETRSKWEQRCQRRDLKEGPRLQRASMVRCKSARAASTHSRGITHVRPPFAQRHRTNRVDGSQSGQVVVSSRREPKNGFFFRVVCSYI